MRRVELITRRHHARSGHRALRGRARGVVHVKTDCLHAAVRGNENVTGGYAPNEESTNRVATVNGVCRSSEGGPRVERFGGPLSSRVRGHGERGRRKEQGEQMSTMSYGAA